MSVASPTLVSVCVCTFRRPHLAATLTSLSGLLAGDVAIEIVVADNDVVPSARPIVEAFNSGALWPVVYVHSPAENISIARNACLDAASGDLLAFIDDDEIATPEWIAELLTVMKDERADAVLGPVQAHYTSDVPGWMRAHDLHSTFPVFVNGVIRTGYTCNVLLDRRSKSVADLRFNLARGKSGGEDTEYFSRLHAAGGKIGYAPTAWVHENIPAQRARLGWLAQRRFRMGQTHGHMLRHGGAGGLAGVTLAGAKAGACFLLAAATFYSAATWRRNALRGLLHVGTLTGLLGLKEIAQYGASEQRGPFRAA